MCFEGGRALGRSANINCCGLPIGFVCNIYARRKATIGISRRFLEPCVLAREPLYRFEVLPSFSTAQSTTADISERIWASSRSYNSGCHGFESKMMATKQMLSVSIIEGLEARLLIILATNKLRKSTEYTVSHLQSRAYVVGKRSWLPYEPGFEIQYGVRSVREFMVNADAGRMCPSISSRREVKRRGGTRAKDKPRLTLLITGQDEFRK
jgi:hypothetical protein